MKKINRCGQKVLNDLWIDCSSITAWVYWWKFDSNWCNLELVPLEAIPNWISNLVATCSSWTVSFSWTWTASTYSIYEWATLIVWGLTNTSYTLTWVNNASHTYNVVPYNGAVAWTWASVTVTCGAVWTQAPVTNLQNTYSGTWCNIPLTWTASAWATQYKVYLNGLLYTTTSGTSVTITAALNWSTTYWIVAYSVAWWDSTTVTWNVTVAWCSVLSLANPTNLSIWSYVCWNSLTLSWSAAAGASSYQILNWLTPIGVSTWTSFTVTWAVNGVQEYTVKSVSWATYSSWVSIYVNINTCASWPTPNPVNNISVGSYSCWPSGTLTWSSSPWAISYNVYDWATLLTNIPWTSYSFAWLSNGNHSLWVTAVNANWSSAISSILIAVSTCWTLPWSPTWWNSSWYTCWNSVVLSWTAWSNATSYNVYDWATFLYNVWWTSIWLVNQAAWTHNYRIYSANPTWQNNTFLPINVTIDVCPVANRSFANNFGNPDGYYLERAKSSWCWNNSSYDVINGNEYNYWFTYTPTNYYTISVPWTHKIRFNYTAWNVESWYMDNLCVQQIRTGQNFPATTKLNHVIIVEEASNWWSPTSSISWTSTTWWVFALWTAWFWPSSPWASRWASFSKDITWLLSWSSVIFFDEFTVTTTQPNVRIHAFVNASFAAQWDIVYVTWITWPWVQIF